MSDVLRLESADGQRLIHLPGASAGHQLTLADVAQLREWLLLPVAAQERLIVLTGTDHFCLGRKPGPPPPGPSANLRIRDGVARPILDLYAAVVAAPLPVVAAVRGQAFGFGCALAGICDVVYAEPGARFALPELDKGVPPALAMRALTRHVAPKRLAEWVLSGREVDAPEALEAGLLSRIIADPLAEARALAATLAPRSLRSLASVKAFLSASDASAAQTGWLAAELIAATLAEAAT